MTGIDTQARAASGWRRVAAFGVDYLVLALYIAALTGASFAVQRALRLEIGPPSTLRARLIGHAVAFVTLTLPVVLYFALLEASRQGGTPGKRALGLRVVTLAGERVSLGQALPRAAAKFIPWELAHTALWHTPGWPVQPQPTAWNWAGYTLSLALSGWYLLSLFGKSRRAPYDHVAGTQVTSERRPARTKKREE